MQGLNTSIEGLGGIPLGMLTDSVNAVGELAGAIFGLPMTSANLFLQIGALPFQALQAMFEAMTGSGAALWESTTILLTPLDLVGASIQNITTII